MEPTTHTTWELLWEPLQPWSAPTYGPLALGVVVLLLVGLTVWTYLGVRKATFPRVMTILGLRLLALLVTLLALLRPAFALRDELHVPSLLILAMDRSQSMSIQDEFDSQSRWAYQLKTLEKCKPLLDQLRDEHNVNVLTYSFAENVGDFDPQAGPVGKRTDFGDMLNGLLDRHRQDRYFRGLVVLSDGADNGTRYSPLTLANQWRGLPCPVSTVGFGRETTNDRQNDIAMTSINPEPSPVPVKGELVVKGTIDAPGFEHARVKVQVLFDDVQVAEQDETLDKTTGNEVRIKTNAPDKPGEIKVTLRTPPQPGETSASNNEITTYLTVIKEGLSVLLVDKERVWEPQKIADALRTEPRIRLYTMWLRGKQVPDAEQLDLFALEKQHYDVIIFGDVHPDRVRAADPNALAKIKRLVAEKGTGFMMVGGYDSFSPAWRGTEVEELLPVQIAPAAEQIQGTFKLTPTEVGLAHYLLRLSQTKEDSAQTWPKMRDLDGMTRLGAAKPGAEVLARARDAKAGDPVMVYQTFGNGRTLAFAADTTNRWTKNPEGLLAHKRFWVNVVLWLAKQEETEGNVWVIPDTRRLASGNKLGFTLGMKGKNGVEIKDAKLKAKVVAPGGAETPVPTSKEDGKERGTFWNTDAPGEYRVVVSGEGTESDGSKISGEASARFIVYQDDAEMVRRAADHDFLKKLADRGGGKFLRPEELPKFLEELKKQPLLQGKPKVSTYPDWNSKQSSGFFWLYILVFVGLLTGEWVLRRRWGLV